MIDQRTLFAMVISAGILFIWSYFFPPPKPPAEASSQAIEQVAKTQMEPELGVASAPGAPRDAAPQATLAQEEEAEAKEIVVETPYYQAKFNSRGGVLTSLLIKKHQHTKTQTSWLSLLPFLESIFGKSTPPESTESNLVQMVKNHLSDVHPFSVQFEGDDDLSNTFAKTHFFSDRDQIDLRVVDHASTLTLTSPVRDGVQLIKTLKFYPDSYLIDYEVQVINRHSKEKRIAVRHIFGEGRIQDKEITGYGHAGPIYYYDGSVEIEDVDDIEQGLRVAGFSWLGLEDQYFISAAAADTPSHYGFFSAALPSQWRGSQNPEAFYGVALPKTELQPNKQIASSFQLYQGPKDLDEMQKFGRQLVQSHQMTLESIANPLLLLLHWIYSYVHNYGVAIIILTIIVRVALFPLTYKGMKSMKRMQLLQPKMLKIRERYKKDKMKMNEEVMALYKKHKVNPLGGCLPLLLQIPIFFGLYSALSSAVELRHAPFYGWITDLSAPDGLGVMPIIMGVSMYILQKMTPNTMMDPLQVKMMNFLPVIFTIFTFTFPTGLTLYWATSNILSIGQQYLIHNSKTPELAEA